jgi:hypothetical protein
VNLLPIMIEPPNLLMFASVYRGSEANVTDMSIQDVPFEVLHINAMHRQIRNHWTGIVGRFVSLMPCYLWELFPQLGLQVKAKDIQRSGYSAHHYDTLVISRNVLSRERLISSFIVSSKRLRNRVANWN